jgi:hypothetical protein
MNKFLLLCRALRAGESLADPATWKNRQLRYTAILAIVYLLVTFLPVPLAIDDIQAIAGSISLIGGLLNGYLTVATTEKVGLPEKALLFVKGWLTDPHKIMVTAVLAANCALVYWWYL